MASRSERVIKYDDHIILKREDNLKIFKLKKKRQVCIDKRKLFLDDIEGHPYGTTFELKDGKMVKVDNSQIVEAEQAGRAAEMGGEKDNRNLQDSDSNQKLSREEIEQMKKEGVTGEHLIGQLIENSATYQDKTEYSKEKWVKKKKKKHLMVFTVLKPNTRLMCEMQWSKDKRKICNLRIDSLAQMLTHGNIRAGMTVAVVDTCMGLVTGAVLERLGGFGKVISFYPGQKIHRDLIHPYDFSEEIMKTLHYFPLELVNSLKQPTTNESVLSEPKASSSHVDDSAENVSQTGTSDKTVSQTGTSDKNLTGPTDSSTENHDPSKSVETQSAQPQKGKQASQKGESKAERQKRMREEQLAANEAARKIEEEMKAKDIEAARAVLLQKNVDCLIVACKFHPTPIVLSLLEYIAPSRQVIVFSQFQEAVQDCYVYLRQSGGMINFRVTETWLREYQVLENRTHPVINMSGTGGYLLIATKVEKHKQLKNQSDQMDQ